jgi:hypothetical protein
MQKWHVSWAILGKGILPYTPSSFDHVFTPLKVASKLYFTFYLLKPISHICYNVHIAKCRFLIYLHFKQLYKKIIKIIWNLKFNAQCWKLSCF